MSRISKGDFCKLLLDKTPLIDVRAPIEFKAGSIPGAVNLPLMTDQERAAVGTTYKKSGRQAAVELGHQLVSGSVQEARIEAWKDFINENPKTVIYCFRGGLRSQITQKWLHEAGIRRPLIEGGYKAMRHFLMTQTQVLSEKIPLLMISGPTGSAKTHFLKEMSQEFATVDLEALAHHRGSAFGTVRAPQPSQVDFENRLALELLKNHSERPEQVMLVEDESRLIGRCAIPESFFLRMRSSRVVFIHEPLQQRVENIFDDYILKTAIGSGDSDAGQKQYLDYFASLKQISRKLGGLLTQEIFIDMSLAMDRFLKDPKDLEENKVWITKLLQFYYDPMYSRSLERRNPEILFKGDRSEAKSFLKGYLLR